MPISILALASILVRSSRKVFSVIIQTDVYRKISATMADGDAELKVSAYQCVCFSHCIG